MIDAYALAEQLIAKNPDVEQNPAMKSGIEAIRNRDSETGSKIAMNICNTYGVSPEQVLNAILKRGMF